MRDKGLFEFLPGQNERVVDHWVAALGGLHRSEKIQSSLSLLKNDVYLKNCNRGLSNDRANNGIRHELETTVADNGVPMSIINARTKGFQIQNILFQTNKLVRDAMSLNHRC